LLYIDHNVDAGIPNGLRRRGLDVLTCAQDGTDRWGDHKVLERATQRGRPLFTQDIDFLTITADWLTKGRDFAGLIYARQLHITVGQAVRDLELIAKVMDPADMKNRIEFLPYS
jgi:hypothetical protein